METFETFATEVDEIERRLAPGSETGLRGRFAARMNELAGPRWRESDAEVDAEEVRWWLDAYADLEADA